MTVEEIFNKLATHMVEGIQFHNELAQAFDFLGLYGFALCHDSHRVEENNSYMYLCHYYSCHYHKLINLEELRSHNLIPQMWHKYNTMNVDANTKRESIKSLMTSWIQWEQETKQLYQEMHKELHAIGEVAAALEVECLIADVTKELMHAEKKLIKLETINYDLYMILDWQEPMKQKYKKKLGW